MLEVFGLVGEAAAFGSGYGTRGICTFPFEFSIVPMSLISALNFEIRGLNSSLFRKTLSL